MIRIENLKFENNNLTTRENPNMNTDDKLHEVKEEEATKAFPVIRQQPRPRPAYPDAVVEFVKGWIQRCVVPEIQYQLDLCRKFPIKKNKENNIKVRVAMNTEQHPEVDVLEWDVIRKVMFDWLYDEVCVHKDGSSFIFEINLNNVI